MSVGVIQTSSDSEWFDSHDDTLTESMLSPELPLGTDLGCSLVGVALVIKSDPRNNLPKNGKGQMTRRAGAVETMYTTQQKSCFFSDSSCCNFSV